MSKASDHSARIPGCTYDQLFRFLRTFDPLIDVHFNARGALALRFRNDPHNILKQQSAFAVSQFFTFESTSENVADEEYRNIEKQVRFTRDQLFEFLYRDRQKPDDAMPEPLPPS